MLTTKTLRQMHPRERGKLVDGRRFTVVRRWPEGRGPGYTDVRFDDGETKSFCWDYENPEVRDA